MSSGAFQFKSKSPTQGGQEPVNAPMILPSQDTSITAQPAPVSASRSDALSMLASMAKGAPPRVANIPRAKSKFVPGRKPSPRSGLTVHDVFKDPQKLSELNERVAAFEKKNPKRKVMGPTIKSWYPTMSDAQARSIARRVHAEHQKFLESKVAGFIGKGAKAALGET